MLLQYTFELTLSQYFFRTFFIFLFPFYNVKGIDIPSINDPSVHRMIQNTDGGMKIACFIMMSMILCIDEYRVKEINFVVYFICPFCNLKDNAKIKKIIQKEPHYESTPKRFS